MAAPKSRERMISAAIAATIVVADRLSKLAIQHRMTSLDTIPVIPGWLQIIHTENPGAAFGMLAEGNPMFRAAILIGISSVVLLCVGGMLWNKAETAWDATRIGLSLILGGAFGNLYDRIVRGTVTDFVEVFHGTWSFPAFNVADSAITVGVALLLWDLIKPRREDAKGRPQFAHK